MHRLTVLLSTGQLADAEVKRDVFFVRVNAAGEESVGALAIVEMVSSEFAVFPNSRIS